MSRIVVVDPSEVSRRILKEELEAAGHTVSAVADGSSAFEILRAQRSALLVTETDLPGIDGFTLTRMIKGDETLRSTRVVIYTGAEHGREYLHADVAGADAVVCKSTTGVEELLQYLDGTSDEDKRGEALSGGDASTPVETDAPSNHASPVEHLERLSRTYDRELLVAGIAQRVWQAGRYIASLDETAKELLRTITDAVDADVAAVILRYEREARVFLLPGERVFEGDVAGFLQLVRDDFSRRPGTETVRSIAETIFGSEEREDYARRRIDGKRISSYRTLPLTDAQGGLIGTLHLGHLSNNYFTGRLNEEIDRLAQPFSVVCGNAVRFNETEDRRRKINSIFAKFVPEEVINDLLSRSDTAELAVGEKRTVAILFSDIRSFTVISEHNSAETIVSFLNAYLERMVRIIRHHGGFIDKFIGDAILAIFGAPISYEDNALRAVRAADEMAAAVTEIDVEGVVLPESGFATGIGVHEGTVIVGNIGSQDKFDYTVIGDNVNLASRLEGLTKHYHARVLMSDVVQQRVHNDIRTREVDTVRVKGKEQATTLYTTIAAARFTDETEDNYRKAVSMYKLGNWTTAAGYFERVLEADPDDYLAHMYISRCHDFAINPPDPEWGGAITLDFK